ncbi:kinase-like domain-containing protein [Zopfochytrium polystomum]|nr:kinase-like domain-containing protein [Zopfochytrium polystomum]
MSDTLREDLTRRNEALLLRLDPTSPEFASLPQEIFSYHSLYPLDTGDRNPSSFGYPTSVYKCTSRADGCCYVLRRIEGFRLLNEAAISCIENWRRLKHVGIVSVREAFTTKAFGDNSLVFVYDYHPNSRTILSTHFPAPHNAPVPEKVLWSYITQLASALKTIHSAGMAARVIQPTKVLVTGRNMVRLNCCGVHDMISYDGRKTHQHFQQDDLVQLGHLILSLACGSITAVHSLQKSLDFISRQCSQDLKAVVMYLLSKPAGFKTIDDVISMIGPRILHEINSAHHYADMLEDELSRTLENGRLVRLLTKLGFINERPDWSETGDRYLLKLFRDYVFHQVDENGRPVLDMSHVVQCLNKLDAGVEEKVMLMSRDEQSCLIVSYRELKHCVQTAFQDLGK